MSYILKRKNEHGNDFYTLFLDLPTEGYYLGDHNLLTINEYNDYGDETLSEGTFVYFDEWADCANSNNYLGLTILDETAYFIIRNADIPYYTPICLEKFYESGKKIDD